MSSQPSQLGFVAPRPQGSFFLPQPFHLSGGLPAGDRGLYLRSQRLGEGSLQSAHVHYPFCCVLFCCVLLATTARSLSNASANSLTPSSVSLSVTSFIEMPAA